MKDDLINFVLPVPELWDFAAFGKMYPDRTPPVWLQTTKSIHHRASAPVDIVNGGERENSRGVSDMFGNVWEWCFRSGKVNRPFIAVRMTFPKPSAELRGGGYLDDLQQIFPFFPADQLDNGIRTKHADLGFRVAAFIDCRKLSMETLAKLWACNDNVKTIMDCY